MRAPSSVVLVAAAVLGCGARTALELSTVEVDASSLDATDARAPFVCGYGSVIDVVYVLDASATAVGERDVAIGLAADTLEELSGCSSVRLGVITDDLGAGGHSIDRCVGMGDDARLLTVGARGSLYVEGDADDLASALRAAVRERPYGCGYERPFDAMSRFASSAQLGEFHRSGAPLIFLYVAEEDDCSPRDAHSLFDPRFAGDPDVLCFVVGESLLVEEGGVADLLVRATPDHVGFGLIAGFEPEDLARIDAESLLEAAARYETRDRFADRSCGDETIPPVRTTRLAVELLNRGAAVGVGSYCDDGGRTVGEQLLAALGAP